MVIRALVSFVGVVCMAAGQEQDVKSSLAKNLIECGYAEKVVKRNENKSNNDQ